jgi:alpha-1,2-glucosyltransferase
MRNGVAEAAPVTGALPTNPRKDGVSARLTLLIFVFGPLALLIAAQQSLLGVPLLSDEHTHHAQIQAFLRGDATQNPHLTTFATYHWIMASGLATIGSDSIVSLRWLSGSLGLLLVSLFALVYARRVQGDLQTAALRAALIVVTPILIPYLFLVFTDALGLAAVLALAWAAQARRWWLAGLFGVLAIAIRQMNVVWVLWALMLFVVRERPVVSFRAIAWPIIAKAFPLLLTLAAFAGFVYWNGGVALGDRVSHPVGRLYDENLFFFLVIASIALLPIHLMQAPAIVAMWRRHPWAWSLAAIGISAWFVLGFHASHHYNLALLYLHNDIVQWLNAPMHRIIVAVPLVWTLMSLMAALDRGVESWIWLAATILVLIPSWLVEHRYGIVPLALWQVLRLRFSASTEWLLALWMAGLGVAAFLLTRSGSYFL